MAKKKNKQLIRPWCWYCEREFEDEKVLMQHQKAKHFKCNMCPRRLNTAGGLAVHIQQVHKLEPENLPRIENALPGRDGYEVEIFGMEGIPAPDVADYKRRKEIELGLAAGSISQPPPKRQKVENRPLSEDELRAQLEAHKALMGVSQPSEQHAPDPSNGGVVFAAPTYISPPVPSIAPIPSVSPPIGAPMFPPPPGMSPMPPISGAMPGPIPGAMPPFPGAPPPGFPPFAPGMPGAPPPGFPPIPPFPPGVTPPFPPPAAGGIRPPFPPPPFLGATPPVPGFSPPPPGTLPPPPTFVPATKTAPPASGTPSSQQQSQQSQSQSQNQGPGSGQGQGQAVRPPQLTLPHPALAQTNPEFKKKTELKWADANFSPEEHRALDAKYYVKPQSTNNVNAGSTASASAPSDSNAAAGSDETRGKKRARAEDFL